MSLQNSGFETLFSNGTVLGVGPLGGIRLDESGAFTNVISALVRVRRELASSPVLLL